MPHPLYDNRKPPAFLAAPTVGDALIAETATHERIAREATAERTRVLARYGSFQDYYNKLLHTVVEGPGEAFDRTYALYLEMFDHEQPFAPDVYYYYFDQNRNQTLQREYGPFVYRVLSLEDPRDRACVAQISYLTVPLPPDHAPYAVALYGGNLRAAVESRMPHLATFMIQAAERDIRATMEKWGRPMPRGAQVAAFTNHMHPLQMAPRDYLIDSIGTGIDAFERALWFSRMGRLLDIPYRRPPPSPEYSADYASTYKYAVRPGAGQATIPGATFMHLHTRYCAMRQRGFDPAADPFYRELSAEAAKRPQIGLVNENNFHFLRLKRQVRGWLEENRHEDFAGGAARRKFAELLRDR